MYFRSSKTGRLRMRSMARTVDDMKSCRSFLRGVSASRRVVRCMQLGCGKFSD